MGASRPPGQRWRPRAKGDMWGVGRHKATEQMEFMLDFSPKIPFSLADFLIPWGLQEHYLAK